jgi:predicted ribosomally synthesized peptide with SipW-like signal peptide
MSLGMVVFVGALAAGATGAFFSDTETSTGNTFAAGELNLTIDNSSYGFDYNNPAITNPTGVWGPNAANSWSLRDLNTCGPNNNLPCLFFNFDDLKPGDYGEDTISLHVQNNAWACMKFTLTGTPENGVNEPEAAVPDATVGANQGELQNFLSFIFWNDDGDNVLETGETVIPELSGLPGAIFTGTWLPIAEGGEVPDAPIPANQTKYIGKGWCFGTMVAAPVTQDNASSTPPAPGRTGFTCNGAGNHNIAQTDGIGVDVEFYSTQSRNNGQFICSSLNQTVPETATVTVDKIVTFSNGAIAGVDVPDFALTIDGPGAPIGVVDEVATAGLPVGVYSISEIYSGNPANVTFNASFSGGCSEVGDTGVGTMNVVAGVNPTCVITNSVALATQ